MTFRHLGRFFRFEASIQKDQEHIVSGPYAMNQVCGMWNSRPSNMIPRGNLPLYSHKDDAALGKQFGTKWDEWVKDVPLVLLTYDTYEICYSIVLK